jgi:DNA-binding NarL/FixJ family response regulator
LFGVSGDSARQAAPRTLEVAIAGDQGTLRRMASALLGDGLTVVAQADSPDELPEDGAAGQPDAVAVYSDSSDSKRAAGVRVLRHRMPRAGIVLVAQSVSASAVRRVLEAGGDGLVQDAELERALPATVRAACAGQACVPRVLGEHLEKPALSYREKQILGMVVLGYTNAEIASRLYLAESTVKSHLSSAFAKLGVRSRNEAAALILDPDGRLGPGILTISDSDREPAPRRPAKAGG